MKSLLMNLKLKKAWQGPLGYVMLAMMAGFFTACQKEEILTESATGPDLQAVSVDVSCNAPVVYPLMGLNLSIFGVCYGPASQGYPVIPCPTGPEEMGSVTVFKANSLAFDDPTLSISINTAYWWIKDVHIKATAQGQLPQSQGVPTVDGTWSTYSLASPFSHSYNVLYPLDPVLAYENCYDLGVVVEVVKLTLFTTILGGSQRTVWASLDQTGAIRYIQDCYGHCPPPTTTLTQGSCTQCNAEVTVTFNYCESVDVSSCKPISKVTIVYEDCSTEDFFNPSGTLPAVGGNGKVISDVYVFSGCQGGGPGNGQGNGQGNGPGNGQGQGNNPGPPAGMHFSAPCPAGNCN